MTALFITLLVAVLVCGLVWWLVGFLPLPAPFQQLAQGLIVIGLVIFILVTLWSARGALPR